MRKLATMITKGGCGKTVTAVHVAAGLAQSGATVLLVDTDTQAQTSVMLGVKPDHGLDDVLTGRHAPKNVIVEARERLWLLASGTELAKAKLEISRREFGIEHALAEALAPLAGEYDFMILDSAPGWDLMTVNVLFCADEILAPVPPEPLALHGLIDFQRRVKMVQQRRKGLTLRYVLPTFFDLRVRKSHQILNQLEKHYAEQLCQPIRYDVRLSEAPAFGQTIWEFSPSSRGAHDYEQLTEQVLDDGEKT